MKYTKEKLEKLRDKKMNAYKEWLYWVPFITIENGFYIIESKINKGKNPLT